MFVCDAGAHVQQVPVAAPQFFPAAPTQSLVYQISQRAKHARNRRTYQMLRMQDFSIEDVSLLNRKTTELHCWCRQLGSSRGATITKCPCAMFFSYQCFETSVRYFENFHFYAVDLKLQQ